jgi:hypothetical protein
MASAGGRIPVMEPAYFHDLDAERLEPGEKPVQGGLIPDGAVQNGFDRLHRGGERLEVKQGLGRYDPDYADLVEGRWHRAPKLIGMRKWPGFYCPARCLPAPHSPRVNSSPW